MEIPLVPAVIVMVAALIAAVTDVWKFKVYNALTVPLLLTGLTYHGVIDGLPGLLESLGGVAFGFGVLVVVYSMGGMGAGDVKLMAAVGAWLGMPLTCYVFLASALASGAYAVGLIAYSGGLRETWVNLQIVIFRVMSFGTHLGADDRVESELRRSDRHRRLVPFGAMVAVGLAAILLWFGEVAMSFSGH